MEYGSLERSGGSIALVCFYDSLEMMLRIALERASISIVFAAFPADIMVGMHNFYPPHLNTLLQG
ncbi:Hypothetical protein CUL131002_1262c [Corynebacterium ulcerans]|nr:Hypothetical protein CUL131002_1262c [Corynebacterium ulcerans]